MGKTTLVAISGLAALSLAALPACRKAPPAPTSPGHGAASASVARENRALAQRLPLEDQRDFEDARRGLIGGAERVVIRRDDGRLVWDTGSYEFESGPAPASVNPSLWRQARLNNIHGLFKVSDRIYQVRGYDLSNMTIIEGQGGWIVVDPLTSKETARAALELARKHLGDRAITAVIFTHSHIDHFGGVEGIISEHDVRSGRVRLIAPAGFVEEATSENILAGIAMGRRASFMYGFALERSARGHVGSGLGKEPARGSFSILAPSELVDNTPQPMTIDGLRFVFQYAPNSEAPAELTFYLPDLEAYCAAELATHNLHNLYTLRGAKVRDALSWSGAIDEALGLFPGAEVMFASHHWPTWGKARIASELKKQRDAYKYIHDQTLRLANAGRTPAEIAEQLRLPEELRRTLALRGYYGTVRHNAKAVYQQYFGWYDGNPAHLDPLPPAAEAKKYVEFMGGAEVVLVRARADFARGEYRWTATVLNHLVFADPDNQGARDLLARTYDQLAYRAESGPWRDVYLSAALELRGGAAGSALDVREASELLRRMPLRRFFDAMAVRLNGPKAEGKKLKINFVFTDLDRSFVVTLEHAVLNYREAPPEAGADVTLKLTRDFWIRLVTKSAGLKDMIFSSDIDVDGSRLALVEFFSLLDQPDPNFAIVTP